MARKTAVLFVIVVLWVGRAAAQATPPNLPAVTDFDFIVGEWDVKNSVLRERLVGGDDWMEYSSKCRIWKHMDGMVILDECRAVRNGVPYVGSSYRIYNRNTGEWSIYWASTAYPDLGLVPQVKGRFQDGVGTFYGEEAFGEGIVKLRYLWTRLSPDALRWEQAYFDDRRGDWETNWRMEFTRAAAETVE